jgi:hypothetical protein
MNMQGNNFLYLVIGVLIAAVSVLSYLYFYKEGHTLFGKEQESGFNLRIDDHGIHGTVTGPDKK